MLQKKLPKSFGTHDGSFHADEVTACALLLLFGLIDEKKIVRTREIKRLQDCEFICDVGGVYDPEKKMFDHHQVNYQGELSSAGMILLYLKDQKIIDEKLYKVLQDSLILGVDAHDNGKDQQIQGCCTYSHVIANFRPISYDSNSEEEQKAFFKALDFAKSHLKRFLERYKYIQSCRSIVKNCMQNSKDCLVFEERIPWLELFFDLGGESHSAKFVIMPSGDHWALRAIPPTYSERMSVRVPLPLEWAGLLENSLKDVSGIDGAVFCHKGRFISVWETKEDAEAALSYILLQEKEIR